MSKPQYAISLTEIGIPSGYLFQLGIPTPLSLPYVEASDAYELGNGHVQISGVGLAVWQWGFISVEERDALRAFCTGYSADVYIRTLDQDNEWSNMKAIMQWPSKGEPFVSDNSIGLSVAFKVLEVL